MNILDLYQEKSEMKNLITIDWKTNDAEVKQTHETSRKPADGKHDWTRMFDTTQSYKHSIIMSCKITHKEKLTDNEQTIGNEQRTNDCIIDPPAKRIESCFQ